MSPRRYVLLFIAALFLSGCGSSAPAPTPALTPSPFLPATLTPTLTARPSATATETPLPTPTQTPIPTPTMAIQGPGVVIVPILLYHHIAVPDVGNPYYVSPENFDAQMRLLYEWGYRTIPISLLVQAIREGAPLPERPIVLTFDDGDEDVYQTAFPIMQKYGFTGVFYIVGNRLHAEGFVTPEQLREMADAGWEIGCHSMSHPDLTELDGDALSYEIEESREIIENEVGVPVSSFAYPFGRKNNFVLQYIHLANYDAAVGLGWTHDQGPDNLFYLHRRGIEWSYDLERFASFLPWTGALETPAP